MKRKDCFFGLHFDYHANEHTSQIGKDFNKDVVERIVTEVQPDFIQCDTKGHPGYCSYMTNVGTRGDLTTDILAGWREVTKKHGVLLFSHYSGLWDMKAAKDHPEWTASSPIQPELKDRLTPFGDYADTLEDAVKADEIFTILMGEQVEPRKEFIEQNAKYVVNLDI